jgi:NAD(P)-dependent dehydrogenase (short-subunit alcohol dehydrogenase family)
MLLENKVAVIYGAGGSIGSAVARVFAREGAMVFLARRTKTKLDIVANLLPAPLLNRTATLADVGNVAAFVASDQAHTITSTEVNISCGAIVD